MSPVDLPTNPPTVPSLGMCARLIRPRRRSGAEYFTREGNVKFRVRLSPRTAKRPPRPPRFPSGNLTCLKVRGAPCTGAKASFEPPRAAPRPPAASGARAQSRRVGQQRRRRNQGWSPSLVFFLVAEERYRLSPHRTNLRYCLRSSA
jgi:hypothetical protein